MEEMLRKFKSEFEGIYYVFLEASDTLDAMDSDHKIYSDDDRSAAWADTSVRVVSCMNFVGLQRFLVILWKILTVGKKRFITSIKRIVSNLFC